ncbi:MAG: hypothetical protein Q9216_006351 [Gyalolechia sp. 2 TL-2023]
MPQLLFDGGLNVVSPYGKPANMLESRRSKSWHKSWKRSKEFPLSPVQEFHHSALPSKNIKRSLRETRRFTTAPLGCSPSSAVSHGESKDVVHESKSGEGRRFSGCPVSQEFREAKAHHPVLASTGCTMEFCQAGRAVHTDEPRVGENRAIEVVEQEAEGFLRELYQEKFFETEEAFTHRSHEILAEIRAGACEGTIRDSRQQGMIGGNWSQTPAELEFGIRRAWRNARKCIMRSHCEELK